MLAMEQRASGQEEKIDSLIKNVAPFKTYRQCSRNHYKRLSNCGHLLKKCLGEDFRPSAGLCMIAFAVPLIVPGITLTVVAFEDQTGFPKYGALHVLGMALLGLAVVLIASGILLNTRSKLKIAADDIQLMESNQEKLAKEITNSYTTSNYTTADEYHNAGNITTPRSTSKLPSYSSAVKLSDDSTERYPEVSYTTADVNTISDTDQKQVVFSARQNSKRKFSSGKSIEECSSSFDSFDSDDFSSGSYIVSEELEGHKSVREFDFTTGYVHENDDVRLFSTFKPDRVKKQAFSFDNISGGCVVGKGSAATRPSVDNEGLILQDVSEHTLSNDNLRNKMALIFDTMNKLPTETESIKPLQIFPSEPPVEASSPVSRQRLLGLSSEAFTTSSEILTQSSNSVKIQDVVFNENASASESSVFSPELVAKSVRDSAQGDSKEMVMYTQDVKPLPCKTWAQSPTTNRPHSFPCGGGITGLSTAVVRIHSLNDTYVTRLDMTTGPFGRK